MIRDSFRTGTPLVGLTPQIPRKTIIRSITSFVERMLVYFRYQTSFIEKDEESLTEELLKYLSYHERGGYFFFIKEAIQRPTGGRFRRVDIGVFLLPSDRTPIFTIEAKRLPAPGKTREREYVVGTDSAKASGGIERYKRNLHGIDTEDSAIVGYIQKNDIDYWAAQINLWIDELIILGRHHEANWYIGDRLSNKIDIITNVISKFNSVSSRGQGSDIELTHYLIVMPD